MCSMRFLSHIVSICSCFWCLERNVVLLNDRLWVYPLKRDHSFQQDIWSDITKPLLMYFFNSEECSTVVQIILKEWHNREEINYPFPYLLIYRFNKWFNHYNVKNNIKMLQYAHQKSFCPAQHLNTQQYLIYNHITEKQQMLTCENLGLVLHFSLMTKTINQLSKLICRSTRGFIVQSFQHYNPCGIMWHVIFLFPSEKPS